MFNDFVYTIIRHICKKTNIQIKLLNTNYISGMKIKIKFEIFFWKKRAIHLFGKLKIAFLVFGNLYFLNARLYCSYLPHCVVIY